MNGQGKTLMLVTVSPEADHSHETLCSLRFASQVRGPIHTAFYAVPYVFSQVSQCTTGGKPKRHLRSLTNGSASVTKPASSRCGFVCKGMRCLVMLKEQVGDLIEARKLSSLNLAFHFVHFSLVAVQMGVLVHGIILHRCFLRLLGLC